jgi:endo-1,4-beta-xylanase
MAGTKNITTDLQRRTDVQTTDRLLIVNPVTKAFQYLEVGDLAIPDGSGGTDQPIEVELVTNPLAGKVSVYTGAFAASNVDKYSGFLKVEPGEQLIVSFTTADFNTSPPIVGTGLVGYSSNSYGSFVSTLINSYPAGNMMSVERYNQAHQTNLSGPINIYNEKVTVPAGVQYVNLSSPNNGVPMSIKAIRNSGTVEQSLDLLYGKINDLLTSGVNTGGGTGGGTGSGTTDNNFTEAYKNKLDRLPDVFPEYRDGKFYLPDLGTGEQLKVYIRNRQWVMDALNSTFGSFTYDIGYAYDLDKKNNAAYQAIIDLSRLITCENGTNVSHLRPSETTWNWTEADAILNYCKSKGLKAHWAHALWLADGPSWLVTKVAAAPAANRKAILTGFLNDTIPSVLSHFKTNFPGIVRSMNVTNEWIYDGQGEGDPSRGGTLKRGMWYDNFDVAELFELCFTIARNADPDIDLYVNDYNQETSNEKQSDAYKALIDGLKAKNIMSTSGKQIMVDGMGFQMHTNVNIDIDVLKKRLRYWSSRGLKVMYTELDVLTLTSGSSSPQPYTEALAEKLATTYYNIFLAYENAVPLAQRGGVVFWTVYDKYYLENQGKNAPDAPTNQIKEFPAPHDYYGQPKKAFQRILEAPDREELTFDVYQDFMVTDQGPDITGTLTGGLVPLVWQKVGTSANVISVNDDGLGSPQNSNNVYNFALVDYPFVNRTVKAQLHTMVSPGSRTTLLVFRYVDANNYIAIQATNTSNIWQIVKRFQSNDITIYASTIVPKIGDVIKVISNGDQITLYINGVIVTTVTDSAFMTSTKCGFKFRGYDDKFSRWGEFGVHHL